MPIEAYYRGAIDFGTTDNDYQRALITLAERAPPIALAWRQGYAEATKRIAQEFARHAETRGWHSTRFQFYLNNKYYWKQRSRWESRDKAPGSSYWLLGEPRDRADFHALAWYHHLYRQGVAAAGAADVRFEYRVDISRPQFDWGVLDESVDLYAVSSAFYRYDRQIRKRTARVGGETWLYGGGTGVETSPFDNRLLVLRSWLLGANGILPTYTAFAGTRGWDQPERLAIILSGRPRGLATPIASIRLKAARRGVQDILYLTLLSERLGREKVAHRVMKSLALTTAVDATGADDPGRARFGPLSTAQVDAVLTAIAAELQLSSSQ